MPAKFTLLADDSSKVTATVPARQAPIRIEYVAFSKAMDRLHIYMESDRAGGDWDLNSLEKDGAEMLPRCEVRSEGRHHRLVTLKLEKPLDERSLHLLSAAGVEGGRHTVQVRAWRGFYPVAAFNSSIGAMLNDQEGANQNSQMCGGPLDKPTLDRLAARGARIVVMTLKPLSPELREHDGILGYWIVDEPDAHDDPFYAGRLRWLGRETQGFVDYISVLHELVPSPTTLCVKMTTRPDNAFVYGQLADLPQHDPYFPPDAVRPQIHNMLQAAAPRPVVAILWAFRAGGFARPSPAVIRMNVYSALGVGAKGISYYSYMFKNRGYGQVPELRTAVHRINAELLQVVPYLAVSHPIVTDIHVPEGIWARAVLCADQALIMSLVNDKVVRQKEYEVLDEGLARRSYRSPGDIIDFAPLDRFDLQVAVPEWFEVGTVALITPEGTQHLETSRQGNTVICRGVNIGAGGTVLITRTKHGR